MDYAKQIRDLSKKELIGLWEKDDDTIKVVEEKFGKDWKNFTKKELAQYAVQKMYIFDIMGIAENTYINSLMSS